MRDSTMGTDRERENPEGVSATIDQELVPSWSYNCGQLPSYGSVKLTWL